MLIDVKKLELKFLNHTKKENIYNTSILVKSSAIKSNNPENKSCKRIGGKKLIF